MKLFLVALTLAVVFICTDAGNYGAILKSVAGTCKDKEGASDDDVNKISEAKVPETKEGKCLVACLGEQFGIIKDNKLSKEGVKAKLGAMLGKDEDKKKKLEEIVDACGDITNDDRCEAAHDIWQCVEKECKDRKLNIF